MDIQLMRLSLGGKNYLVNKRLNINWSMYV